MENFVFHNKTKIVFGKKSELKVGSETKKWTNKVLLHYGSGSIKKSGLHGMVTQSLSEAGITYIELDGVQPNPRLDLVKKGISICRENNIQFILAVGGGSVIDSAKAIAVGVPYQGDVWDFFIGKAVPKESLAVGTVLTIPAAGSEASPSAVITNNNNNLKRGITNLIVQPVFSILNPELTFTLPPYQTACGTADIMAHLLERYFTTVQHVELTDRLCEAAMKTLINNVFICLKEPHNYDARAEIMWTGTVAHNDLLNTGRIGDWGSHMIEHELSGMYDVTHGAGLAAIFPAWMKHVYKSDINRFVQFASRVWNVEIEFTNLEKTALQGIEHLEQFFQNIGLPTSLKAMGIPNDRLEEMASICTAGSAHTTGNFVKLDQSRVLEILKTAYD